MFGKSKTLDQTQLDRTLLGHTRTLLSKLEDVRDSFASSFSRTVTWKVRDHEEEEVAERQCTPIGIAEWLAESSKVVEDKLDILTIQNDLRFEALMDKLMLIREKSESDYRSALLSCQDKELIELVAVLVTAHKERGKVPGAMNTESKLADLYRQAVRSLLPLKVEDL